MVKNTDPMKEEDRTAGLQRRPVFFSVFFFLLFKMLQNQYQLTQMLILQLMQETFILQWT